MDTYWTNGCLTISSLYKSITITYIAYNISPELPKVCRNICEKIYSKIEEGHNITWLARNIAKDVNLLYHKGVFLSFLRYPAKKYSCWNQIQITDEANRKRVML